MKKLLCLVFVFALAIGMAACGGGGDSGDKEKEAKEPKEKVYKVGETWEVKGEWKFTITEVTVTEERNSHEDWEPAAVYAVAYTLENTGYVDPVDESKGLYFTSAIVGASLEDAKGEEGKAYATGESVYESEPLVGETTTGLETYGVKNPGEFKLTISKRDSKDKMQEATFLCKAK